MYYKKFVCALIILQVTTISWKIKFILIPFVNKVSEVIYKIEGITNNNLHFKIYLLKIGQMLLMARRIFKK